LISVDPEDPGVVERLHELDLAVLHGALERAHGVHAQGVLGPHGGLQVLVELLAERHGHRSGRGH
jgi:hypothetical protein